MVSAAVSRRKARSPETISYSTAPKAKMSVRESIAAPRICSGGHVTGRAHDHARFRRRTGQRYAPPLPRHTGRQEGPMEVQHVAALPRIPDGQAPLCVYSLGDADLQSVRLAEAMLFAAGRLRRHVRGAHGSDQMGQLRHGIGQSEMRQLHGAQRLWGIGRARSVRQLERIPRDRQGQLFEISRRHCVAGIAGHIGVGRQRCGGWLGSFRPG